VLVFPTVRGGAAASQAKPVNTRPPAISGTPQQGQTLHGEVESFSAATGAKFTLLPPDNATVPMCHFPLVR